MAAGTPFNFQKGIRAEIKDCDRRRYPTIEPPEHHPQPTPSGKVSESSLDAGLRKHEAIGHPLEISGKAVDNYKAVLESMGYTTGLERFTVDSRGDSPELREEFGEDYLDNKVIIVSEAQFKNISLLEGNMDYMHEIVPKIPKELVKAITPYEALTGKVNILYGETSVTGIFDADFKDYPSSSRLLHAILSLDTLEESVKKINFLNNKVSFITESSLKNLGKDLVNSILAEIHPLTTKYGSVEAIKNSNVIDLPLEREIFYFEHKDNDVFFFNKPQTTFLVYKGKRKTESKLSFEALHVSEKSKIMDYLVKNDLLKVEKENIFKTLESMAKSFLGIQVKDCSELAGFHFYKVFKKFKDHPEISEKLKGTDWYILRDACYGNIEFSSMPLGLKEMVTRPRDEIVGNYLELLDEKSLEG